jgi:hypothetical protein
MIADMFGDKPDAERDALIGVVQELMGAALIDKKPRALSKACVGHPEPWQVRLARCRRWAVRW